MNVMVMSSTKLRLFSHRVFFIIKTLFPPLHEALYAGTGKLFAETSELFRHAVFQLVVGVVVSKTASSEVSLQGVKNV